MQQLFHGRAFLAWTNSHAWSICNGCQVRTILWEMPCGTGWGNSPRSKVTSHMWYSPSEQRADRTQQKMGILSLASFYQDNSKPLETTIPKKSSKRPFYLLCSTNWQNFRSQRWILCWHNLVSAQLSLLVIPANIWCFLEEMKSKWSSHAYVIIGFPRTDILF